MASERLRGSSSSKLHLQVSRALRSLGVEHSNEYSVNGLLVDIVFVDKRLALEVDGPSHYFRDSKRVLGTTLFKRHLLERMGWRVLRSLPTSHSVMSLVLLSLPYFEWGELSGQEEQQAYLRALLA